MRDGCLAATLPKPTDCDATHITATGYAPGEQLTERYRLVGLLAEGGMGAVWIARDELLDADVALKLTFPSRHASPQLALRRAHNEARLAAGLRHPAICATLDFGVSRCGDPFVVTELLQGGALDEVLASSGKMSPTEAAQLLLPILDGLALAHEAGIVHRDVKPSNIFLSRTASASIQPKLLDFGIARGHTATRMTVTGTVCGTPDYMSPEQARGCPDVDHRSDVWSVCATLYELVSGRVPFAGDNYNAVMRAVIEDRPSPLLELSEEDRPFAVIVARGLRKPREQRFQTAAALAECLAAFLILRGIDVDASGRALRAPGDPAATLASVSRNSAETKPRGTEPAARSRPGNGPSRIVTAPRLALLAATVIGALALSPHPSSAVSSSTAPTPARPAKLVGPATLTPLPTEAQKADVSASNAVENARSAPTDLPQVAAAKQPRPQPARTALATPASEPVRPTAATPGAPPPGSEGASERRATRPATPAQNALGFDFGL